MDARRAPEGRDVGYISSTRTREREAFIPLQLFLGASVWIQTQSILLSNWVIYYIVRRLRFSDRKIVGTMKTTTRLLMLDWLGGIFALICAVSFFASVYFLYGVFASVAPWYYPLWSFGAGVLALLIAAALNRSKRRMAYMSQLMQRGYRRAEAAEAWRTAFNGGMNLLRHLQQTELCKQIDRFQTAIITPKSGENSA